MSNKPVFELKQKIAGHFTLETRGPDGELRNRLEFDNLITDTGLDHVYNCPTAAYGIGYYCNNVCVGTGNAAPANTDTSLSNFLASTGIYDSFGTTTYVAGPPTYWKSVRSYTFGTGVAAGNLTEIGTYPTNGSSNLLFSRALIVDGGGAPTTLVVEADEILTVTYELRVYIDTADVIGTFVSGGVTYDTVLRPADIDSPPSLGLRMANTSDGLTFYLTVYDGVLGTVTTQPNGSSYNVTYNNNGSLSTYANGQRYIDLTTVVPVGSANWANGVKAMYLGGNLHKFQISFIDPLTGKGIPKVNGEKMSITFRFSWDRYAP